MSPRKSANGYERRPVTALKFKELARVTGDEVSRMMTTQMGLGGRSSSFFFLLQNLPRSPASSMESEKVLTVDRLVGASSGTEGKYKNELLFESALKILAFNAR